MAATRPASSCATRRAAPSSSSTPDPGIVGVPASSLSRKPRRVSLLLTHYHWDHLLGLPFFSTLYEPGWTLTIHTPALESHDPAWLDTIFKSPFFPVPYAAPAEQAAGARWSVPAPFAVPGFDDPIARLEPSGRMPRVPDQGRRRRPRLRHRPRVRQPRLRRAARGFREGRRRDRARRALHAGRASASRRMGAQRLAAVRRVRRARTASDRSGCFTTSRAVPIGRWRTSAPRPGRSSRQPRRRVKKRLLKCDWCQLPVASFQFPVSSFQVPVASFVLSLATGNWQLAAGNWQLATDYLLCISGFRGSFRYGRRTARPLASVMTLLSTRSESGGWKPSLPSSDDVVVLLDAVAADAEAADHAVAAIERHAAGEPDDAALIQVAAIAAARRPRALGAGVLRVVDVEIEPRAALRLGCPASRAVPRGRCREGRAAARRS